MAEKDHPRRPLFHYGSPESNKVCLYYGYRGKQPRNDKHKYLSKRVCKEFCEEGHRRAIIKNVRVNYSNLRHMKEALIFELQLCIFGRIRLFVISWIHRESRELKTFVANRVSTFINLSSVISGITLHQDRILPDVVYLEDYFPEELHCYDSHGGMVLKLSTEYLFLPTVIAGLNPEIWLRDVRGLRVSEGSSGDPRTAGFQEL
ncbi:hypothetical protein TNCV_4060571 [Trichonephila clavipes]|nr:hypothetical protein TNCV_4060571 [Trichonephila clavipes]